jgi:hypothetical protein
MRDRERTLQINTDSPADRTDGSVEAKVKAQKQLVEDLKVQWKLLWSERFNDKVLAEGISVGNYEHLSVEKGTVIHATRDFKPLNFKEILEKNMVANPDRFMQPNVDDGGWNKFVKKEITNKPQKNKPSASHIPEKKEAQRPKKCGRGWLHVT